MRRKRKNKRRAQTGYDLRMARFIKRRQWEREYGEKRQQQTVHTIEVDKGEIFIVYY